MLASLQDPVPNLAHLSAHTLATYSLSFGFAVHGKISFLRSFTAHDKNPCFRPHVKFMTSLTFSRIALMIPPKVAATSVKLAMPPPTMRALGRPSGLAVAHCDIKYPSFD